MENLGGAILDSRKVLFQLRNEIAELSKIKDLLSEEVAQQRKAKTEAYLDTINLEAQKALLNSQIDDLERNRDKIKSFFLVESSNYRKTMDDLDVEIDKMLRRKEIHQGYVAKMEVLDRDLLETKGKIDDLRREIADLEGVTASKRKSLLKSIESIENREKTVAEKEKELLDREQHYNEIMGEMKMYQERLKKLYSDIGIQLKL